MNHVTHERSNQKIYCTDRGEIIALAGSAKRGVAYLFFRELAALNLARFRNTDTARPRLKNWHL